MMLGVIAKTIMRIAEISGVASARVPSVSVMKIIAKVILPVSLLARVCAWVLLQV